LKQLAIFPMRRCWSLRVFLTIFAINLLNKNNRMIALLVF